MTDHKSVPQTHTLSPTFRIPEWVLISEGRATFRSRGATASREEEDMTFQIGRLCERGGGDGALRGLPRYHVMPGIYLSSGARGRTQCRDGCICVICNPTDEGKMDA